MASLNLEQLIEEIQVYIDNCKPASVLGGSSNMIKVNRDELIAMLDEVKLQLPKELKESQELLAKKDAIIAEAKGRADSIIEDAAKEASQMIDENEIVALSKMRAQEIDAQADAQNKKKLKETKDKAQELQVGALEYTQTVLAGLEEIYATMLEQEKNFFESVVQKMDDEYQSVRENKAEIDAQLSVARPAKPKKTSGQ